jgi:hypothetical protein
VRRSAALASWWALRLGSSRDDRRRARTIAQAARCDKPRLRKAFTASYRYEGPIRFFRIRSSIASTLTVWRAMMRCICAFSTSSCLSRTTSLSSMPAYFARHNRIVFAWTPCRRPSSRVETPASNSRRISTICDSEKRLLRMGGSPCRPIGPEIHNNPWLPIQGRPQFSSKGIIRSASLAISLSITS